GNQYRFPFTVIIENHGGERVEVSRVVLQVYAGSVRIESVTMSRDEIAARGFATTVPAGGEVRYTFDRTETVPDERLFSDVSADLRVDGIDAAGNAVSAAARVTVRRGS
ncbi:MAG TPA: hypothetical protein VM534_06475, partial [Thermoanaerobaculia bacterium]|nr:hypothetical protein [Thermoanaerobaculia bacterium]